MWQELHTSNFCKVTNIKKQLQTSEPYNSKDECHICVTSYFWTSFSTSLPFTQVKKNPFLPECNIPLLREREMTASQHGS